MKKLKFSIFKNKINEQKNGNKGNSLIPKELPLLPLRNSVMFPNTVMPLVVGREKSVKLVKEAIASQKMLVVVAQKDGRIEDPEEENMYTIGTVGTIIKTSNLSASSLSVIVQGLTRIRVKEFVRIEPYYSARIEVLEDQLSKDIETEALLINLKDMAKKAISLSKTLPNELTLIIENISEAGKLADLIASNLNISIEEKQGLLETLEVKQRLKRVSVFLNKELQALEMADKIHSDVVGNVTKAQREFYLREQLKAIKKELGEDGDDTGEIKDLREKIKNSGMPKEVEEETMKELNRLSKIHPSSAEYTVSRTYLDWLVELPWIFHSEDNMDLKNVRDVLDEDHYNLDKVKKRTIEYLAVRKLKPDKKGPILCFAGPPGVGKTSLGKSIAKALGRKFVRISLGGVRDEAEIRGHRRTYVGALPGRIIQGIKRAASKNPVFMLDEIDKLGSDFRGDPSSALLEVLDPEQNFSFSDHYLNVPFDLSRVMFIVTANVLESIPKVLLDRMEVLDIPGYTEEEKLMITKKHIIPKQIEEHGLKTENLGFSDNALRAIIRDYTREAGLRNLEREIATICRKVATDVAEGKIEKAEIDVDILSKYLGPKKFFSEIAERLSRAGIATGLAWTSTGGDIIFVEASRMNGKGNLTLTGQLGDVMKESAQAALTYVRSQAKEFNIPENFYEKSDIHVHVPAGAIPKDGPSAGITIFTALLSLLTEKRVRSDIAMTGEITLRGMVLPVGGIKEKVLAARRAGIKRIILPKNNEKDLEDVPENIKNDMQYHFISRIDEAVKIALEKETEIENQKQEPAILYT
ncbi:MAG: endopeptidase La [Candidatus Schekmanbacteria bacterium GWA2_38_9]|uniref:Lon protease n=1 Tax=Candidatus Schekmanbacteria bacterium RIFCSPLOWO2_12_FULL_38_15 TaxID=1817883 RepID=A0A1F7SDF7_9BACT|nr:MAG: endopeptidase La [Candidatus Schekmanbacteria bacterium GWA2_38_9]OGL49978.1 MAG: endopeptidase La [Candidatus Schekmanbacteria bacterium RIFCSPLOWO2_02_FULL_38_14]OGL51816.1 MAG: endopeptidase La [Candidatus Schekmanbacteria bacterium RIFCSPLOWO2_12_FULL_38_15]